MRLAESEVLLETQMSEVSDNVVERQRPRVDLSLNFSGRILSPEEEENMETMGIKASDELYLMLRSYCLMI